MNLKVLWFFHLLVISISFMIEENFHLLEQHTATTVMLSRLIEESKRSTLLVVALDSEILDSFVRLHSLQITVEVNDLNTPSILDRRKIDVTILHFESYDQFENFFVRIQPEVFLYDGHFIIMYDTANLQEIEKIFSTFWKSFIYNVGVLLTSPNSPNLVSLFTYLPFANESCKNTNAIQINQFDKTAMNWSTNEFFPKKFKQLNRCPLRFGCYENSPGVLINNSESGLKRFTGMNIDFCVMFSGILNFTLNILEYEKATGVIYPNKTATALLRRVIDNEIDFIFGSLQRTRVEAMSATRIVHSDKLILVVPPPFLIDPMTKIFLPFTFASWISIGTVALLACCIVKILDFTPRIVHDYVIGSNVKGSVFNVCNVFLGGTQKILPRSNFPRFLLAKFLIFTMIMRSLYQGEVFDILKRDVRTVELTTIDEFIQHKFTFYIYQSLAQRLEGSKIMQRHEVISEPAMQTYKILTLNSSFKGIVFDYMGTVIYENFLNRKNFTLRICREVLNTNSFVFYFTKNFYLVDKFNEMIHNFEAAGIVNYVTSKYIDINLMEASYSSLPSALSYQNIEGFFTLFYYGCVLALVSFICEIIFVYVRERNNIQRELKQPSDA